MGKHNPQITVTCPASPKDSVARPEMKQDLKELSSVSTHVQALKLEFLCHKSSGLKEIYNGGVGNGEMWLE